MNKIRLVTVTGSRTDTLEYMLTHYYDLVDEIYVVAYDTNNGQHANVKTITDKFKQKVFLYKHEDDQEYNWETVTAIYNEIKSLYPNDWWVVSDDDEFHVYSKPLQEIVSDCESNGWNLVRGGFIDRIGPDGNFAEIKPISEKESIFSQFPMAGFFRTPLSSACPNKVCIMKGNVEITAGQHYAKINGQTTWRWQGWNHPQIAPTNKYSVQVHHFKWDKTVGDRIKKVADIRKEYAYSTEYLKMYQSLKSTNFKLDTTDIEYVFEYCPTANFENYKNWSKLFNKIISI